jgi:hypothetical protein
LGHRGNYEGLFTARILGTVAPGTAKFNVLKMKFNQIRVGGKYWHLFATNLTNSKTGKKVRNLKTIRVVAKNADNLKVCASINGAPAEWFDGNTYRHWKTTNPELDQTKTISENEPTKAKRPISRFFE